MFPIVTSSCLRWLVTQHYRSTRENNEISSWTSEHNVTLNIEFFLNYLFSHGVFIFKHFFSFTDFRERERNGKIEV